MPDTWTDGASDPRTAYADPVGEWETVLGYLRSYRLTIEMKCEGLTPEQLATRSVPPSTMSLLGLVRHLARVEHHWFRRVLSGQSQLDRIFWSPDDNDLDFNAVAPDGVEEAFTAWKREIGYAEQWASTEQDLAATVTDPHGNPVAVRDVLVHMVEEYARHAGHADLLRECLDGRTGQ